MKIHSQGKKSREAGRD
jgi:hypothetical protein